ncbi:hypothetical protein [Legionella shakespearei]|nr:hypothetical protein [Legionella shakespearei]
MYIYFQNLAFQNKQILWAYPEGGNSATCLYQTAGNNNTLDRDLVNDTLRDVIGIEIKDGVATISHVDNFSKRHPYSPTLLRDGLKKSGTPGFFPVHPHSSSEIPTAIMAAPQQDRSSSTSNLRAQLLSLDHLLENHRGATLVYEQGLPENNLATLALLTKLRIHSPGSLNLALKVIQDVDYYHLRQKQMHLIRTVFEEFIIPSLQTFRKGEEPPKSVNEFFLKTILATMANDTYNLKDTLFEESGPMHIPDNYKLREIYARRMMNGLLYFIEDTDVPLQDPNPELAHWLEEFKKHLQIHHNKLVPLLDQLKELVVCTGLMYHDFSKFNLKTCVQGGHIDFSLLLIKIKALQLSKTTLKYAMNRLDTEHRVPEHLIQGVPPRLYSLRLMLLSNCPATVQANLEDQSIDEFINEIISEIISDLRDYTDGDKLKPASQWISHTIKTNDTNLHLHQEWHALLEEKLKTASLQTIRMKQERKHPETWKQLAIEAIKSLTADHLPKLLSTMAVDSSSQTTSTMSP